MSGASCVPCGPRYVRLYEAPPTLRGRCVAPIPPAWPIMDPADVVIGRADFGPLLNGADVSSFSVDTSGVTVIQSSSAGSIVSVALSSGTVGTAQVAITALSSLGEQFRRVILQPVALMAPADLAGSTEMSSQFSGVNTLDATPKILTTLSIVIGGGTVLSGAGRILARNTATGDCIVWDVSAVVKAVGTTTPAIVGTPNITVNAADADMEACSVEVSAGPAGIVLTGIGIAATPITWSGNFSVGVA